MLTISPATACHYCSGYGGGYYYSDYSSASSCDSGCGSCGDGCGSDGCYGGECGGGCGGDYVSGDCGNGDACGDCGAYTDSYSCGDSGCAGCDGFGSYGHEEGVVVDETIVEDSFESVGPPTYAPEPPSSASESSTVNRQPSELAPTLPPEPLPSHTESEMTPITPSQSDLPPVEPAMPSEVATPPATTSEPAADDMFGEPSTPVADEPIVPADESLPPAAETPTTAPANEDADLFSPAEEPADNDMFDTPAEETLPAEEKTEEEQPAEEKSTESDDLFGDAGLFLRVPGGLASSEHRKWVDNTGSFSCQGRMLRLLDGKVQLLKDNGRTATVPLSRLSRGDLEFVHRQASAQQSETISKTAQVTTGW